MSLVGDGMPIIVLRDVSRGRVSGGAACETSMSFGIHHEWTSQQNTLIYGGGGTHFSLSILERRITAEVFNQIVDTNKQNDCRPIIDSHLTRTEYSSERSYKKLMLPVQR